LQVGNEPPGTSYVQLLSEGNPDLIDGGVLQASDGAWFFEGHVVYGIICSERLFWPQLG
jgi:hypothetical protein